MYLFINFQDNFLFHSFLKLLPQTFNIKSTDDSFEWLLYIGIFPQNVFIAQLNENGIFTSFTQFKIRNSSVVKIFSKNKKVQEIFQKTSQKNFCHVQRFLELVKFDSDLDDKCFDPIVREHEITF